jgi:hypothetical protein
MTHCLVYHHITGHLVFVLLCTQWVMMCPAFDNTASCKIRCAIRFLHAKSMSHVEIHGRLCAVYKQIVINEDIIR